jgi:hypothetical protein
LRQLLVELDLEARELAKRRWPTDPPMPQAPQNALDLVDFARGFAPCVLCHYVLEHALSCPGHPRRRLP